MARTLWTIVSFSRNAHELERRVLLVTGTASFLIRPLYDVSVIAYSTDAACLSFFFGGLSMLCVYSAALYVNFFYISFHGRCSSTAVFSCQVCALGSTALLESTDMALCNAPSGCVIVSCLSSPVTVTISVASLRRTGISTSSCSGSFFCFLKKKPSSNK